MNILRPWRIIAALVLVAPAHALLSQQVTIDRNWTAPIDPVRIFENVYYVGTEDLASYLITTPQGHVLVDSGVAQNAATITKGIEQLGFKLTDVKYLLTTQAHFDHVAAHAELQRLTGAQVVASVADAELLETGGKADYHFGPAYNFSPVKVNRRVKDGETVTIGGTVLTAHLTPGHTQGTTTWVMKVTSGGVPTNVVFVGSTAVNPGVKLVGNTKYPSIAEDFAGSFERLKQIKVDVFLTAHLSATGGLEKMAKLRKGVTPNPFVDPSGYAAYLERSKKAFETELDKQRKGAIS